MVRRDHKKHNLLYYVRRSERRRMLVEAFRDGERGEVVAVGDYPLLAVGRGEVLFDVRGYVSPSLRGEFRE